MKSLKDFGLIIKFGEICAMKISYIEENTENLFLSVQLRIFTANCILNLYFLFLSKQI